MERSTVVRILYIESHSGEYHEVYQDRHEDLFGINVYHAAAFGIHCKDLSQVHLRCEFLRFRIIIPNHFRTYELVSWNPRCGVWRYIHISLGVFHLLDSKGMPSSLILESSIFKMRFLNLRGIYAALKCLSPPKCITGEKRFI